MQTIAIRAAYAAIILFLTFIVVGGVVTFVQNGGAAVLGVVHPANG